ncbi:MAG: outer membrane protein assembly factor BamD [Thermodesulfobacteriota bacterium]
MKTRLIHKAKTAGMVLVVISLITGCSLLGRGNQSDKTPEQLMSEGIAKFSDGYYEDAAERFRELTDRYPYSKLAVQAELKLADSLLKNEDFEAALEEYKEFESLHPKNKSIPYVIYQQGMCYFLRMNTTDRDQTNTVKALNEFERLQRAFPFDDYSLKAQDHIEQCLTNMAEHELYVGRFYFRSGHYKAALNRFHYLLEHYPDHSPREKVLSYISECQEKVDQEASSE